VAEVRSEKLRGNYGTLPQNPPIFVSNWEIFRTSITRISNSSSRENEPPAEILQTKRLYEVSRVFGWNITCAVETWSLIWQNYPWQVVWAANAVYWPGATSIDGCWRLP